MGASVKELNTKIWNNSKVVETTGYSMDTLKECLFDLATFMSQNLHPDRLKGFNIAAIKNIASFEQIPACVSLDLE